MNKVRVLVLSGCRLCEALLSMLDELNISYVPLDADVNSNLADDIEKLLGTINYPIATIIQYPITTHLYRAEEYSDICTSQINSTTTKIGCASVETIIHNIKLILNK